MASATTRARLVALLAILFALAAAAFLLAAGMERGLKMFMILILLPAVASALYLVWRVHPAYTLSAAIFLSPLSGNWGQLGFPSRVDPDRILLVIGILQVLLRAPAMRERPRLRFMPAYALMALAVLWALGSAFLAGTLYNKAYLFRIVDAFGILPFLVFVTAPLAFRTKRQRNVLLVTLVVLGAYLGLTTLFEMVHLKALVFPRYINNPNYGIHYGRGRGPFVDAVANGFACFVCSLACGVAVATWRRQRTRGLAALIGLLCLVGAFLSLERSVWIGASLGAALAMITTRRLRPYVIPFAGVIVVAVIAALALIPGLRATVHHRISETTYDRQSLVVAGLNMIEARPLTGFGWGQFRNDSLLYFRQSQNYPLTDVNQYGLHNFLLTYAVELGLPGATLWMAALLVGVGTALMTRGPPDLSPWRGALLGVLAIFIVVSNSVPPIEFPNLAVWVLAGVVCSGRYAQARTSATPIAVKRGAHSPALDSSIGGPRVEVT